MSQKIYKKKDLLHNMIKLKKSDFVINDKPEISQIKKHKELFGILLVYVDWCKYCIESKEVMIKLAKELGKFGLNLYMANLTKDRYLPFIKTFPSLFFINNIGVLSLMNCVRKPDIILNAFANNIEKLIKDEKKGIKKITKKIDKYNKDIKTEFFNDDEILLKNSRPNGGVGGAFDEMPQQMGQQMPQAQQMGQQMPQAQQMPQQFDQLSFESSQMPQQQAQAPQPQQFIKNSLYNNSNVIQLSHNNIIKLPNGAISIKDNYKKCGILKAYASWCGYCQMSVDKIKRLADKYNRPESNITIYVLEMTDNNNSPLNLLVEGFPTYLYVDNKRIIYPMNDDLIQKQVGEYEINAIDANEIKNAMNIISN
jgi:thiol-disulfide isomerase/thioredoxin